MFPPNEGPNLQVYLSRKILATTRENNAMRAELSIWWSRGGVSTSRRVRFAEWEHLPDYWNVHDVDEAVPAEALGLLAWEIHRLAPRFRRSSARLSS